MFFRLAATLGVAAVIAIAFNPTARADTAAMRLAETGVVQPADEGTMLSDALFLGSVIAEEQGELPQKYVINSRVPRLSGQPAAGVDGFNQAVQRLVDEEVTTFREFVAGMRSRIPPVGPGSNLSVGYSVSGASSRVVSLFVGVGGYTEGAAHPYHFQVGFTYDLAEARQLDLADVFVPDSAYLSRLASFAVGQLEPKLGDSFFTSGAEPRAENYVNWNLTPDALIIEFNEYQVAPYAAGPQSIAVPYTAIEDILRHDDRLASVRRL